MCATSALSCDRCDGSSGDDMEGVCDMVKVRMWVYVACVCVHDTRSIVAPPLLHPLGKTDSLLGTIASFVLQQIRLL